MKFYRCKHCRQIVAKLVDKNVSVVCCGEQMEEIIPGSVDASKEKHVPVYKVEDSKVTVTVGSINHPMAPEHFIEWVLLETKFGNQRRLLTPGSEPVVEFAILPGDEVVNVYAYCNLHGLWKA